jgi:Protein of unknown function DUF262/Protein of unknown function (DUF1524)
MAGDKDSIEFEHKGIGAVLSQNRLGVPLNQREYAWEEEHVQELFSDFAGAIDNDRPTYFLGTVVLTHGGDEPEVSDGQQRLATATILLTAIRDYLKSIKDYARAASIEQDFLKTTDFETTDTVPRLRLNVDDNEFFKSYVIDGDHTATPKLESHKKIKAASDLAVKHVAVILEPHQKQTAKTATLQRWVKFVRDGAQVVVLRVPDHLNAFMMFETLNDRGLKASQADLIKNYLLRLCGDHISEAQQKWAKMRAVLESIGQGDITVNYLHHLLITKQGPTKEREVFDKVRGVANSRSKALQFLEDAAESADDYAALFNPGATKWNEYGTSTRKHLTTINRDLRVEQIRPLMFAIARHFGVNEAKKAFKLLVYWSVRFLIVGGRGGLLDRNYSLRAQEVSNKTIKNAAQLTTALNIVPSDALFEQAFSEVRVSQDFIARYLLRALEMKAKGSPEPENIPNDEENVINVEHILPEHPEDNWPNIDKDMASALHKRLGNMVLMQASKNSLIGNSAFSEKKKVLKESAFALTSEVAKESRWEAKQIKERQAELAKLAVETWPIS